MRKLYKLRNCAFCGEMKETLAGLCDQCAKDWQENAERDRGEDYDYHSEHECSMCGKEGAKFYEKQGWFCSHCWMVWTS